MQRQIKKKRFLSFSRHGVLRVFAELGLCGGRWGSPSSRSPGGVAVSGGPRLVSALLCACVCTYVRLRVRASF